MKGICRRKILKANANIHKTGCTNIKYIVISTLLNCENYIVCLKLGMYVRLLSGMFGYPSTQVTGQFRSESDFRSSGRARSDGFDPAQPKSTRKSDQKYPDIPESTLYDPEFDVDSKSAVKIMITTRNLELQLPIETAVQASQLDIPTRPDRTEPIFELAIELT